MAKLISKIKKIPKIFKKEGFKGIMRRIMQRLHVVPTLADPLTFYDFIMDRKIIPFDKDAFEKNKDSEVKILNWVIPEMGEGSGGHTTIFRFISNLEKRGFHSRVYVFRAKSFFNNQSIRSFVARAFPILDSRVEVFYDVKYIDFAHATFATSWETAYFVRNFENTISKFYFVQDFEPHFFAHGSEYEFAENTYHFGLRGITAGDFKKS